MPARSDESKSDEIARNRRLAERIASGRAVPNDLDEVITSVRQMAGAHLDVPGPRAAQIADEVDRLKREAFRLAEMIVDLREQGERRRSKLLTVEAFVERAERDGEPTIPTEKLRRAVDGPPRNGS